MYYFLPTSIDSETVRSRILSCTTKIKDGQKPEKICRYSENNAIHNKNPEYSLQVSKDVESQTAKEILSAWLDDKASENYKNAADNRIGKSNTENEYYLITGNCHCFIRAVYKTDETGEVIKISENTICI